MVALRRKVHLFLPLALIIAQLACSFGGFTINKDEETSQPQSEQSSNPIQPEPTAEGVGPEPTRYITVSTPTSSPAIKVAPPQSGMANVAGRVLWNSQPVVGTEVKLCEEVKLLSGCEGIQFSTYTDDKGYYVLANVTPGKYVLLAHAIDADRWIYITSGLGLSAKKYEVVADQTLSVNDQHIFKFDLNLTYPAEEEKISESKPTLSWDAYPNASYYEVYFSPRSGESIRENVTEPKFSIPRDLLNCEYTWTVEVFNAQKIEIAEHEGYQHFEVVGQTASCEVLLTSPQDGANLAGENIQFSWEAHPIATRYLLYVSDENYKNVIDGVQVNTTTYTATQILPPGKYSWYVSAYDGSTWIAASAHYDLIVNGP